MTAWLLATILATSGTGQIVTPPKPKSWPAARCTTSARGQLVPFEATPSDVLSDLWQTDPRMSPPGGPFNPSDVVDGVTPQTRIIAVMRSGQRYAAAYEKGGRGYSVTVRTYAPSSAGRLALSNIHTLAGGETRRGWVMAEDACAALERALD